MQQKVAQIPLFLTDADLRRATTTETSKLTEGNLDLDRYLDDETGHVEVGEEEQVLGKAEQETVF